MTVSARRWRRILLALRILPTLSIILFLSIRFVLSDRFWPLNYIAYVPGPAYVLAALLLPWMLPGRLWFRAAAFLLLIVAAVAAVVQEHPLLARPVMSGYHESAPGITILTWNVQAYHGGMDVVIDTIRDVDPDILCLVEGTFGDRAPDQVRRALGPDYQWAVGRRLSIASRVPIRESQQVTLTRSMWALRAEFAPEEGDPFAIVLIDVNPPFRRSEGQVFSEIRLLRQSETLPLVMAGDFNTPRHSFRLRDSTHGMLDATIHAGRERWTGTWPVWPMSLWQLDYLFFGREFRIHRSWILHTSASDHHGVVAVFQPPGIQ